MRRIYDFHGGIYPAERKTLSNEGSIRKAAIPSQLVLPLAQHIGPTAAPAVAVGQEVRGGERLTDLSGLPLHAPTSGVIGAIEERPIPHASGMMAPCIVINCDKEDRWIELTPVEDFRRLSPDQLGRQLFEAGIAGLGGAGFPTARKLPGDSNDAIKTLIINGTECEPYITSDDALMRERADRIIAGVEILAHIARPKEILIGIEDNKPEAIAAFETALARREDMELVTFPTKYPSGGEKQLIEILTGKEVPSGGLPASIGILCQNVGTAAAVHDAIVLGRPLVSRVTTVTGESARNRGNFDVLLGTPMEDLLAQADYQPTVRQRLIMGGPMMGVTLADHRCPVIKTTNCLLVPGPGELPEPEPAQACIRCGLCAEACPARLLPQQLYWFARAQNHEQLEEHHLFDCIECGACSYVCPSHIPLVQYYRASKAAVREQKADNARADHARERFEARQERMAREAAEKEAKRAARKRAALAKAADQAADGDPIQAAIERAQARKAALAKTPGDEQAIQREKLARIETRLAKAREKLAADDGSDPAITSALEKAVATTESKLADLQTTIAGAGGTPARTDSDSETTSETENA
ncbi:electron transport complex subunit RsxC [Congregibacter litoralis]|uniref:Ion-translocating oxidoreductase complex subunit C n=1 Tax=Congregibacter litoralis KT71 TaxID=314285 RepID=A4ACM4_9GAMM|nr:electron transport complex subunit RsxC [Congregibacter litoralis]EAQ96238.1 electron transport complex, RnfABCDGE type, C subunit [Congregibacter litoralis KT71]